MRTYVIRRLLLFIPSLFILSMLVFFTVRLLPGDAADLLAHRQEFAAVEIDMERLREIMGLDVPASLSFLGFGLPLNVPSWGGLLSREGRYYMQQAPWLAMWPGIFLTVVVYSFNMFGDAVRDLLDPRLRGGVGRMGAHGGKALQKAGRATKPAIFWSYDSAATSTARVCRGWSALWSDLVL